jgi:glycine oxidase
MIDPRLLLADLRQDLIHRGVRFLKHENLLELAAKHEDGIALHCLGSADTSHWPALRSVRGEAVTIHAPNVKLSHSIRVMHPRYPLYVVPRDNERFYIGATQIESDDTSPLSVRSTMELLSAAASLDPNFLEARIETTHIGLRPTLRHGEPRIKKTKTGYAINGLYRHGILLAPYVAQSAAALLLHNETSPFFIPDEA